MTLTRCALCPWEQEILGDQAAADRALTRHASYRHGAPTPAAAPTTASQRVPQLAHVAWHQQAVAAVKAAADSGEDFTIYEALVAAGVSTTPPNHAKSMGTFTKEVARLLNLHYVRGEKSRRPETAGSQVSVWCGPNGKSVKARRDTA